MLAIPVGVEIGKNIMMEWNISKTAGSDIKYIWASVQSQSINNHSYLGQQGADCINRWDKN